MLVSDNIARKKKYNNNWRNDYKTKGYNMQQNIEKKQEPAAINHIVIVMTLLLPIKKENKRMQKKMHKTHALEGMDLSHIYRIWIKENVYLLLLLWRNIVGQVNIFFSTVLLLFIFPVHSVHIFM